MKLLFAFLCFILLTTCSKTNVNNDNCRFLLDIGVNETINLNFYQELKIPGNSVSIPNAGNGGIIIAYTGADYFAWDAADPNHTQMPCSILQNSGLNATCGCEDKNEYSLVNGQPLNNGELRCGLRNYRVDVSSNSLIIYN